MKERSHTLKALGYLIAPTILVVIAMLAVFGTMRVTFPERFAQYEVLMSVISFFLVVFSVLCTLPCGVMTMVHSIFAMVKDRKYLFPIILIHLDLALISFWIYVVVFLLEIPKLLQ